MGCASWRISACIFAGRGEEIFATLALCALIAAADEAHKALMACPTDTSGGEEQAARALSRHIAGRPIHPSTAMPVWALTKVSMNVSAKQ